MRKEGEDVEEKDDSGIVAKFGHNVLDCSQVTDKNKMHYIFLFCIYSVYTV